MATFPVAGSSFCGENQTSSSPAAKISTKRKASSNATSASKKKRPCEEKDISYQVYEVEHVVGHKVEKNKHFYLVKWKDWSPDSNTWEPIENLNGCHETLFIFLDSLTSKNKYDEDEYQKLKKELSNSKPEDLSSILKEYVTPKGISIPPPDFDQVSERLRILSRWPVKDRDPKVVEVLRKAMKISSLYETRQNQLDALKEWEEEMNSIIYKSKNPSCISVLNNVDLVGPPENFIYINDYLPGANVDIPDDPPLGCECDPYCSSLKKKCCPTTAGGVFAYDKDGKVKVPPGTPIYECNKRCQCSSDCINRVVQNGRTVKLCIFRTSSGCGWGVKTLETIPKGAFVSEYVGEVITFDEAEKRGQKYDKEGQTYLFDLDFNDTNAHPFTVDAAIYGNISHFVNHSCDPNMTVYAVWADCLDPDLPKLALFANREIKQGEEISFDYLNQSKLKKSNQPDNIKMNGEGKKSTYYNMVCKCGSKKCRKFYL